MGKQLYLTGNNDNTTINNNNHHHHCHDSKNVKKLLVTGIVCLYHIILKTNLVWCNFFRFCAGDIDEYMHIFLDTEATKEAVIQAGICNFSVHLSWSRYYIGINLLHVLKEGGSRSDQTRDSTSNKGCSCTACTQRQPADPGLDPSTEHVSEPQWLWMDIRCTWVWASSNTSPHGPWGSTEVHQL